MDRNRKLILDDGTEFYGSGFGGTKDPVCEVVFNTSMAGYQEILSDPSYTDQAVVMSYPLIGNYGITNEDFESRVIAPSALIIRDLNEAPSNFRSALPISQLLEEHDVPGICGVDTRKLVRHIRDHGSCRVLVTDAATSVQEGLDIIRKTPERHDAVRRRSCADEIIALSPDGVLVSNGPGDPTDVPEGYHSQPNEGFNGKSKARRVGSLA